RKQFFIENAIKAIKQKTKRLALYYSMISNNDALPLIDQGNNIVRSSLVLFDKSVDTIEAMKKTSMVKPTPGTKSARHLNDNSIEAAPPSIKRMPDKFRGIKWGSRIEDLSAIMIVPRNELASNYEYGVSVYRRNGDKLKIGDCNLDRIHYYFYRNKFCRVNVCFNHQSNFRKIMETLSYIYGTGRKTHKDRDPSRFGAVYKRYVWIWDEVDIELSFYYNASIQPLVKLRGESASPGHLIFTYKPIWKEEREKDRRQRIKDGEKDL
ncbi:MAG: hypothetical protein JRD02_00410, partial [Deltaproteobacteria bacterium]|nr:hypothetical protein [Deltaproteobacteria bacterium]